MVFANLCCHPKQPCQRTIGAWNSDSHKFKAAWSLNRPAATNNIPQECAARRSQLMVLGAFVHMRSRPKLKVRQPPSQPRPMIGFYVEPYTAHRSEQLVDFLQTSGTLATSSLGQILPSICLNLVIEYVRVWWLPQDIQSAIALANR